MSARFRNELRPTLVAGRLFPAALEASGRVGGRSAGMSGPAAVPDKNEAARVAASRASTKIRLFAVANSLSVFLTATFVLDPRSAQWMKAEMAKFLTRLRRSMGKFPFLWVPERSESGRLHVHALLPPTVAARFADSWSHGGIDIEELSSVVDQRSVAAYMAKDFGSPILPSRYYVARGFQPQGIPIEANSRGEFLKRAIHQLGGADPSRAVGFGVDAVEPYVFLQWGSDANDRGSL